MCGRFTYRFTWRQLCRLYGLTAAPTEELAPRFNVAPTQAAPIIRTGDEGRREGAMLRWGLVPSWSDGLGSGPPLFNARGESVADKPSFRAAFKSRRCLVPVSGFYEWQKSADGKTKQPLWIGRADREPFTFAGLWERWERDGSAIESFTIITTTSNHLLAPIHDRMPVIVEPAHHDVWLDSKSIDMDSVRSLIRPAPEEGFETYPVSARVNSPRNDEPSLLDRAVVDPQSLF